MLDVLMLFFTALVIALIITCIGWLVGYIIIKIDSIMFNSRLYNLFDELL